MITYAHDNSTCISNFDNVSVLSSTIIDNSNSVSKKLKYFSHSYKFIMKRENVKFNQYFALVYQIHMINKPTNHSLALFELHLLTTLHVLLN